MERDRDGSEALRWTCQPARRQPGKAVAAFVACVACSVIAWWVTETPFFGAFFFVILMVSIAPFYLPTTFILDDDGVEKTFIGIPQRRSWSQFRAYYPDRNGVQLSPFNKPSFLEHYRGIYIRFEDNQEDVIDYIRRKMETD